MRPDTLTLYRVVAPHFVAGIVADGGRVVDAAPILAWSVGETREHLRDYFASKRWRVEFVEVFRAT
jgi:hypothetical protein